MSRRGWCSSTSPGRSRSGSRCCSYGSRSATVGRRQRHGRGVRPQHLIITTVRPAATTRPDPAQTQTRTRGQPGRAARRRPDPRPTLARSASPAPRRPTSRPDQPPRRVRPLRPIGSSAPISGGTRLRQPLAGGGQPDDATVDRQAAERAARVHRSTTPSHATSSAPTSPSQPLTPPQPAAGRPRRLRRPGSHHAGRGSRAPPARSTSPPRTRLRTDQPGGAGEHQRRAGQERDQRDDRRRAPREWRNARPSPTAEPAEHPRRRTVRRPDRASSSGHGQNSSGSMATAANRSARYAFERWNSCIGASATPVTPRCTAASMRCAPSANSDADHRRDDRVDQSGVGDRPEQQRDRDRRPGVEHDLARHRPLGRHHRQHRHLGRGVVLAVAHRQRPGVRRRPEEHDEEQHHRRPGELAGDRGPADQRREAAGQPAPHDVLRGAPLEQHRVDEDVEQVGGEGEPGRQRVDEQREPDRRGDPEHDRRTPRLRGARPCARRAAGAGSGASARRCRGRCSSSARSRCRRRACRRPASRRPATASGSPPAARNITGTRGDEQQLDDPRLGQRDVRQHLRRSRRCRDRAARRPSAPRSSATTRQRSRRTSADRLAGGYRTCADAVRDRPTVAAPTRLRRPLDLATSDRVQVRGSARSRAELLPRGSNPDARLHGTGRTSSDTHDRTRSSGPTSTGAPWTPCASWRWTPWRRSATATPAPR